MSDPEIYRYEESGPYPDVASLRERYARTRRGPGVPTERWWNYAVIVREHERAIGTVELTLTDGGAHVEIGYSFAPAYWGLGYAYEATSAAIDDVIARARPRAIDAYVDARNVRSYALLERLGFRRLGLLLGRSLCGGLPADDYHYRRPCGDRGDMS
ncbi:MAG: hypothetical protein NVS2B3_07620 [Vulcanimicrobiaceae bacterium]